MTAQNVERMAYLIMVCPNANNNKFYRMTQMNGENSFEVEYGRIGTKGMVRRYPIRDWTKKYEEKLNKGYVDKTDSQSIVIDSKTGYKPIENPIVGRFVGALLEWVRCSIRQSYTVSVNSVTPEMIREAQKCIDALYDCTTVREFNDKLVELYTALPRKMKHVDEYLITSMKESASTIDREQDLLNNMRGQVKLTRSSTDGNSMKTILEAFDLEVEEASDKEMREVLDHMGVAAGKVVRAYKVRNRKTEEGFKDYCNRYGIKKFKYLYHGSLNENFWSIFSEGLSLNPKAKKAGKMFGNGLYFASKAVKSMRYTSLRGNNNVHGGCLTNKGVLAVFKVATGNAYHVSQWDPNMVCLSEAKVRSMNKDSVFAHKGVSLVNDEMIVYNKNACTIRYLLEIE